MPKASATPNAQPEPEKPKRGRGNPDWEAFEPTPEQRNLVLALTGYGIPQQDIAALIESPVTGKGISEVTLRKYFPEEIAKGKAAADAKVVGALFKNATTSTPTYPGGIPTCQIFWAKARMGWKGAEDPGGSTPPPPPLEHRPIRDIARRIAFLLTLEQRSKGPKKLPA